MGSIVIDFFLIVNYYLDVYEIKPVPQWERFSDEPITYDQKLFTEFF